MTEVFGEDLLGEVDLFVDLGGSCPFPGWGGGGSRFVLPRTRAFPQSAVATTGYPYRFT